VTLLVVVALAMVIAIFVVVSQFKPPVPGSTAAPPLFAPMVVYALSGAALLGYIGAGALAVGMARRAWASRENDDQGRVGVARVLLNTSILRGALVEAPALLAITLLMTGGNSWLYAVPGMAAFLLLSLAPARARFDRLLAAATDSTPPR
jgi:hypothetical protein